MKNRSFALMSKVREDDNDVHFVILLTVASGAVMAIALGLGAILRGDPWLLVERLMSAYAR